MSATLQERPTPEYAIDDPEILFGELETFIAAPFDAGHIIHLTRQLQKHGGTIRNSSGSFQHGCLITASIEEPRDILDILANTPGIRDARINSNSTKGAEEFIRHWLNRIQSKGLGVQRIEITTEPRKEEISERLEALNHANGEPGMREGAELLAEVDPSCQMNQPHLPIVAHSGDGWARRVAYDIRSRSLKR